MERVVYYHHPRAENFSLESSSISREELATRQEELDSPTKLIEYELEPPVYVLYEGDSEIDTAENIDLTESGSASEAPNSPAMDRSWRFD